jgi:hypothetical protein
MLVTQRQLNRAVARATGEHVSTIRSMGFGLADPAMVRHDPEPGHGPQMIDWDALASPIISRGLRRNRRPAA